MAEGWNKTKEEGTDVTAPKKRTRRLKMEQFPKYQILKRDPFLSFSTELKMFS
jgi:hypothetical protein